MMAAQQQPPSTFSFPSSPLDTLVRSASKRRTNGTSRQPIQYTYRRPGLNSNAQNTEEHIHEETHQHSLSPARGGDLTPPRHGGLSSGPPSPLLHGHFSKPSNGTAFSGDNSSYMDFSRESIDTYRDDIGQRYQYDTDSVYSENPASSSRTPEPALRDSWNSSAGHALVDPYGGVDDDQTTSNAIIPAVVISSPYAEEQHRQQTRPNYHQPQPELRGSFFASPREAPVPGASRSTSSLQQYSDSSRASAPLIPPESQKQKVLARNADRYGRARSISKAESPLRNQFSSSPTPSMYSNHSAGSNSTAHHFPQTSQPYSPQTPSYNEPPSARTLSTSRSVGSLASQPPSPYLPYPPSPASHLSVDTEKAAQNIPLSRKPPSIRPRSPASSIYSGYSYYQLDDASRTPSPRDFPQTTHTSITLSKQEEAQSTQMDSDPALEYLQLGIQKHESNQLRESAVYFEKSATENGGCGVGMLMWGLTLRHGWGTSKNEKAGFKWLRKAAEHAIADLEGARTGGRIDQDAVKSELVLAIYEVGQCFFHGWGVAKDQKMGFVRNFTPRASILHAELILLQSYYTVAARLGDADAQMDLGFCFANGKGCKKDRKESASWYRKAVRGVLFLVCTATHPLYRSHKGKVI